MYLEFSMFLISFHPTTLCTASFNQKYHLPIILLAWGTSTYLHTMQFGKEMLHILQHNLRLSISQYKGAEAQIHNPERNAVSQTYHRMTLPLAQPQSQETNWLAVILLIKTKQCSVIFIFCLCVFPSGNDTSRQTYTLDTQQKNGKSIQDVTVPFRLIRPGVWPVTRWTKFWLRPMLVWPGTQSKIRPTTGDWRGK